MLPDHNTANILSELSMNIQDIWPEKEVNKTVLSIDLPPFAIVTYHSHCKDSLLPSLSPHTKTPLSSSWFPSHIGETSLMPTMIPLHHIRPFCKVQNPQLHLILCHLATLQFGHQILGDHLFTLDCCIF